MDYAKLFEESVSASKPLPNDAIFTNEPVEPIVEEDDEINGSNHVAEEEKLVPIEEPEDGKAVATKKKDDPEKLERTIFVGNVNRVVATKAGLKAFKAKFSEHGKIESIRFRSVAFEKPLKAKHRKIGFINHEFHENRDSCNAYVVYKSSESVEKALKMNGTLFEGKHIRVDSVANPSTKVSRKKSVFVGNLPFDAAEEDLWRLFQKCGTITNVRIIRDSVTNVGKGIAYVEFKERAHVISALKLNKTELGGRQLRIEKCIDPQKKKVAAVAVTKEAPKNPALRRIESKQKGKKPLLAKKGKKTVKK